MKTKNLFIHLLNLFVFLIVCQSKAQEITGEQKKYHKVTLTFDGPSHSETDDNPNPFKDYRLNVTFTSPSGATYKVPGYFAADGNASESGASSGNKWRVHFTPAESGSWNYSVSFRSGEDIAASTVAGAGTAVGSVNGQSGSLNIGESDKSGKDFRAKGKLEYTGKHYFQFSNGDHFIKMGANAPELLLEYTDFDGTSSSRNYSTHVSDWNSGDPTWNGGKGKGIIGVVNYLSGKGMNVHYFLTMNAYGDGKKAYPWTGQDNYYEYDVSKLDQWQVLFDHMMSQGMMAHIVTNEQENQSYFEAKEGTPGQGFANSRKVYYRELVARFGYLNAVTWNIGEENGWEKDSNFGKATTTTQRLNFAGYLQDHLLYYNDPVVVHNGPSGNDDIFDGLLGSDNYTGISYQGNLGNANHGHGRILHWREQSASNGQKWVVNYDEAYTTSQTPGTETLRESAIWASLMAGGGGFELYTGNDLGIQDYRTLSSQYETMNYAREFFINHLPFHQMEPLDNLTSRGWCLADEGKVYAIYLPDGGSPDLDINVDDTYSVQWYDPRNGGGLQNGSVTSLSGTGTKSLGEAPSNTSSDWVVLVTQTSGEPSNISPTASITSPANGASFSEGTNITINASAIDSDGSISKVEFYRGSTKLGEDTTSPYSYTWNNVAAGNYSLTVKATDNDGATTTSSAKSIEVTSSGSDKELPGTIQAEDYDAMSGIQTENTSDSGGGQNVGYIDTGDYMDYNVTVAQAGIYEFSYRVASPNSTGKLILRKGSTNYHEVIIPNTGNWQNWTTVTATANLVAGEQTLRVYASGSRWNINWFSATLSNVNELPTASITSPANGASFSEGTNITISASASDSDGSISKVEFYRGSTKLGEDTTSPYSYTWNNATAGNYSLTVKATDNDGATTTSSSKSITVTGGSGADKELPGTIQAEDYDAMSGIQTQSTSDIGGGQNVGYIDAGDYMDYNVTVVKTETYEFSYRVASKYATGEITLQAGGSDLHVIAVPNTGNWQNWETIKATAELTAGTQTIRIYASGSAWNINWFEAVEVTAASSLVYAINAGGSAFTATNGREFEADNYFTSGNAYSNSNSIANTEDDNLYNSERYGNFAYNLPVNNGTYTVTLKLAEIYFSSANQRLFNVRMEGTTVESSLDIYNEAGAKNFAYDISHTITVSDGSLNIEAISIKDNAKISAILVESNSANARASTNMPLNTIAVYPTVTFSALTIKGAPQSTVRVYNMSGKMIATFNIESDLEKISINADAGIYNLVIIKSDGGMKTVKVIKR